MEGDELTGIADSTFRYYDEFQNYLLQNRNKTVILNILRQNEKLDIPVVVSEAGMLGVVSNRSYSQFFELKTVKYGLLQSVPAGISKGFKTMGDYLKQFKLIFSKDTKAYESLGVYCNKYISVSGTGRYSGT